MDPAAGEYRSGDPPRSLPSEPAPLLTWPTSVQIALCLCLTAFGFFLLGRWTHSHAPPAPPIERGASVLDLNRATKAELRLLPGLGDTLAQRVVDYRARQGRFHSVEDLRYVSGIGAKTLDRLRPWLFVAEEEFVNLDEETEPLPSKPMPRVTAPSKKLLELTAAIDVNSASQAELQKLPGIGPKLSQRILDERAKAPFKSVEELRRVPGIGPKTLEKIRPHIIVP